MGKIFRFAGQLVVDDVVNQVAAEENGDPVGRCRSVRFLQTEDIVPASGMEHVGQKRGSQYETHLFLCHAGLDFGKHFGGDEVSLLDIDLVWCKHIQPFFHTGRFCIELIFRFGYFLLRRFRYIAVWHLCSGQGSGGFLLFPGGFGFFSGRSRF